MIQNINIPSYNGIFENAVRKYWNQPSVSDYRAENFTYAQVAIEIDRLHRAFKEAGVEKGERIALCNRNSSRWGIAFWAIITYGAVAVPVLHEFHPDQVADIVDHSETKILFIGQQIWKTLDKSRFESLPAVIDLADYSVITGTKLAALPAANSSLKPEDLHYHQDSSEEMAILNYTSGTTSNSKGVMIPYRALWSNYDFAVHVLGHEMKAGDKVLSMLPMAHMYGMAFEFLFEMLHGMHVTFLNRNASPTVLLKALADTKPRLVVAVPLIIEKVVRRAVIPALKKPHIKVLMAIPGVNCIIKRQIRNRLCAAFGGNFYEVIMGGAALAKDIEAVLRDIKFPFTVGYGTTETAPILAYEDWRKFVPQSCGKAALHMELRIDSKDPQNVSGEILARGLNTLLGYYKNPEATAATLDKDGWYHTGDMGVMDKEGNLFIKGRCKNMLLGSNGQNIYPEEIEDKINAQPCVGETVVIQSQKDQKLYALIYPDAEALKANGVTDEAAYFEDMRKAVNKQLPNYSQVVGVKIWPEEFEKTPKKSIKRFKYLYVEV